MADANPLIASGSSTQLPKDLIALVVDSDPISRFRLKAALRGTNMVESVSEMSSANGIPKFLAERPVSVILIDESPGVAEIYEIVQQVRQQPGGDKTQWVLISDQLNEDIIARGRQAGVNGFIPKPYDIRGVESALKNAMGAPLPGVAKAAVPDALREMLNKLRRVALFSGFKDQELVRLLKICKTKNAAAGTYIFHEGEPGYELYVVVSGKIDIKKTINGEVRTLVSMGSGDCFGEMAIISDEPRFADAVAASDCTMIEVNEAVVNSNEDMLSLKLVRQIAILLARKLRAR